MEMVDQVFPIKRQVALEGLYLGERLRDIAAAMGRSVVLTDFLSALNGVIAKAAHNGGFEIPAQLKNSSDWGRYQELLAQADVIISGGSYFKRLATSQDVLFQFEPGHAFETLGRWRLDSGYMQRSPGVAIVTRDLDFPIPEKLIQSGRRIVIFTTDSVANSTKASSLRSVNTLIVGSGKMGVEGDRMITTLADHMGYKVIMMVTGPRVLDLLLQAGRMDLIYVTEAHVKIPVEDPATVQTVLLGGQKVSDLHDFRLVHQFNQEHVVTEAGSLISQSFFRYDKEIPRG